MAYPMKASSLFKNGKNLTVVAKYSSSHLTTDVCPNNINNLSVNKLGFQQLQVPPILVSHKPMASPLSILPFGAIFRSLVITSVSCSPKLLGPSLKIMSAMAHEKSPWFADNNPLLRAILKRTIYRQFCAGENKSEVTNTLAALKKMGIQGVILNYAREVVVQNEDDETTLAEDAGVKTTALNDVLAWKHGTLATISMTSAGDFVAVKFSGAGSIAMKALKIGDDPPPTIKEAADAICDLAASRGVRLLIDAEQTARQPTVDNWTLEYMRLYNKNDSGKAVIYNTYQAYLKACPDSLANHLAVARRESFTLGVKLVRGAYLGADPRNLIHDTKADTDAFHDGIAESLVRSCYGTVLRPAQGEDSKAFPSVNVMLAGHNLDSIRKVQAIRTAQAKRGESRVDLVYAQLQGMADEISCELVQLSQEVGDAGEKSEIPEAYKYVSWGTVGECTKYLLRRAQENKDAVQRTKATRDAMWQECVRRMKKSLGF